MITGVLTILLEECLFFGSETILIWALLFFFINTIYFILLEEPDLDQTFGDEYKAYKKETPRWIPRFRPYTSNKK
jgi:protein-S-isoprenylcysteine O-methyltransferase Ste14